MMSETKSYQSYYETELELARLRKDSAKEFELLAALADADEKQGDVAAAIASYKKALVIAVSLENERNIVFALGRLGLAYFTLGDRERCKDTFEIIRRVIDGQHVFGKAANSLELNFRRAAIYRRKAMNGNLPDTIPSAYDFVGNEKYIETLQTLYAKGIRLFNLHGAAGVGKTSVAVRFANEIDEDFEAKIFLEMPGASEKKFSWRDAMIDIIRKFEFQIFADISDEKLKTAFTRFVEAQNTLIVLDNAWKKDAIEPLLAASACFIVTSRGSLDLPDGEDIEIHNMSPADAERFLTAALSGRESIETLDKWARIADYKPMALKILASNPSIMFWEAAALLNRMRDEDEAFPERRESSPENITVEAALEITYQNLSGEMREYLRCLAVFPADFDEAAMASVLKVSSYRAYEIRKRLAEYSLLETNTKTDRLFLHKLVRSFADKKLSGDERFKTYFFFSEYYASILIKADEMQSERNENYYSDVLRMLDSEWHNIAAGQKWAADFIEEAREKRAADFIEKDERAAGFTEKYKRVAELCIAYAGYARNFVTLRLSPAQDLDWLTSGLNAAKLLNDRTIEGSILGSLGNAYDRLGDYQRAIEYHEWSLKVKRKTGNRSGEALSYGNLGLAYDRLGRYDKAIEYHEKALKIAIELGDRYGESISLGNLGFTYHSLGEPQKAIEYDKKYLDISREIGNRYGEGASLGNLGIAYAKLEQYDEAIDYLEKALVIAREIGDLVMTSNSLTNLGAIYEMQGKYDEAVKHHTQALEIFRQTNNLLGESNCLGNLGNVYDSLKNYPKAIEHYEQALEIAKKIGYRYGEGAVLGIMGTVYQTMSENKKACEFWQSALDVLKDINSPDAENYQQKLKEFCGQ